MDAKSIDERILKILGISDTFDLDDETYYSLLREAMVRGANTLSLEEMSLLANERKRVKTTFEQKQKKISAQSISRLGSIVTKTSSSIGSGILALSQKVNQQQVQSDVQQQVVPQKQPIDQDQLTELNKTLSSILNTVNALYQFEIKKSEEASRFAQQKARESREEDLESKENIGQKVTEQFQKVISPLQGILDKIFQFITFIFLGKVFLQFVDWIKDPKNQEKIESLGRFLKDFWPLLLALYITPFRKFIFTLTGKLFDIAARLSKRALGPVFARIGGFLTRVMAKMPWLARLGGFLSRLSKFLPGLQTAYGIGLGTYRATQGDTFGAALGYAQAAPGPIGWIAMALDWLRGGFGFATGGLVSGPKGIDKVPAYLTEGEVVMNKQAVDAVGAEIFLALNRLYGGPGANKPKKSRFNTGGYVGNDVPLVNQKAFQIYQRLVGRGLSLNAAKGIVANIGVETGYTYDPSTVQRGGGPGRGLVQWETGGRFDKDRINLMSFAKSRGTDWNDMNTQVDFIIHELNTHPEYMKVKQLLNRAKSVQEATEIFLRKYEKAGTPHTKDRMEVGKQFESYIAQKKEKSGDQSKEEKPIAKPSPSQSTPTSKPTSKQNKKVPSLIDMLSTIIPYRGGGFIDHFEGMKLDNPPNNRDTQAIAVEKGEYLIPKDTVDFLGKDFFDKIVAKTDLDSTPNLLAKPEVNRYKPTPLRSGTGNMMTLPPQVISGGMPASSNSIETGVPIMSAISPGSDVRSINSSIYGIG